MSLFAGFLRNSAVSFGSLRSPGANSKLAADQYTAAFHAVYGLETVALGYFNVFGPRQNHNSLYNSVVRLFIGSALDGK